MSPQNVLNLAYCALLALAAAGCGNMDNRPPAQPPAELSGSSAVVNSIDVGEQSAEEVTPTEVPAGIDDSVRMVSGNMRRERRGPARVACRTLDPGTSILEVRLWDYPGTCSPTPTFAAHLDEGQLILQEQPRSGPVARCPGFHSLTLELHGLNVSTASAIIVRDRDGEERARSMVR